MLGRVDNLVKRFVRKVSLLRGLSEAAANSAGGKIFTFGSYRLGVHGPASDIDTLCVVPKHVSREDFFEIFEPMLKEVEGVSNITVRIPEHDSRPISNGFLQAVPEAYVPVISAEISGIPLDFLMARLALSSIPEDLSLQDDNLLRNLDDRCVRSLNGALAHISPTFFVTDSPFSLGSRVVNEILRLVPNVQVFRDSLRCIKLWAQRKTASFACTTPEVHSHNRTCYLFQRKWFLWRCRLGHRGSSCMSIVSQRRCGCHRQSVLRHHASLVYLFWLDKASS